MDGGPGLGRFKCSSRRGRQRSALAVAALAFLAANLLHGADHIRQDLAGVDLEVLIGGGLLTLAAMAVVLATRRRHPQAPLIATAVGLTATVLVAVGHIPPHWSVLSDSYTTDIHPDALWWLVMLLEIAAAAVLALVGAYRLHSEAKRRNRTGRPLTRRPASPLSFSGTPK